MEKKTSQQKKNTGVTMIIVNAKELKKSLSIIKEVHKRYNKEIAPLTINTLANAEKISLATGNGTYWAEYLLDVMVGEDMNVNIDLKEVYHIVKGAKNDVTIWRNGDQVIINAGGIHSRLSLLEPQESFKIPQKEVKDRHSLTIPSSVLKQGIDTTSLSVSQDETKMVLTKLNIKMYEDGLKFASTDGHRLSVYEVETPYTKEGNWQLTRPNKDTHLANQFNIPNPILKVLSKALKEKELKTSRINFRANTSQSYYYDLVVSLGDRLSLTANKLDLDEKYPLYEMLIPKPDRYIMTRTFEIKPVLDFLIQVKSESKVSFKIDFESITFETVDRPLDEKVTLTVPLSPGDNLPKSINLNPRYLLDVLSSPTIGKTISLTISDSSPILFNSENALYLIMPIL